MRISRALVVARMLLLFFVRRALTAGALRLRSVRIGVTIAAVVYLVGTTTAAYYFLDALTADREVWDLLFDATTVSTVLWVLIAFLVVKVLFIQAEGMLELTFQLPVTNRERSLAFLLYEVAMTGIIAGGGLFALTVCAVAILGATSIVPVFVSIIGPAVLTYLVLAIVHQLLVRLWIAVRLERIAGVLNVVALFGLVAAFSTWSQSLVGEIAAAYLQGRRAHGWVTAISRLQESAGTVPALVGALLAAAALCVAAVALSPRRHVHQGRYVRLWTQRWVRRVLNVYDLSLVRSSQTVTAGVLAAVAFLWLAVRGTNPLWALSVMSFSGLYQFSSTTTLRVIYGRRRSPLQTFGLLVRAQALLVVSLAALFALVAAVIDPEWAAETWKVLGTTLVTSVVMIGVGVIFPTEKDNPLAVLIGVTSVAMVVALAAMALGMLNLPVVVVGAVLLAAVLMFATYAVLGIHADESRRRNEAGAVGREHRRRVSGPDSRRRGGSDAAAHVPGGQLG